ncbi:UDP-N-acetylglucosamine 2-epimerase [Poriferisphaera sp. WC338]|uniref:UDP-N-acetylglucosamine 2-epimerase n=1 Tax=Poriferisphaera sp. WC338 TaxID=3425129 RepID=UPI003D816B22
MTGRKKHVCFVTGTRAEFGLLRPMIEAAKQEKDLKTSVIVAGLHLTTGTWRDVKAAGIKIDAKVRMQKKSEVGRWADVEAVSRGVKGFGEAFAEMKVDVVAVLGDRVEAFAAASAASIGGRYVVHVHGGDRAEGVADEAMRHAITKLAHLHFAASKQSMQRLIRLGERKDDVYLVGSPAIDGLGFVSANSCDEDGVDLIVLQHPVGETNTIEKRWMMETLVAARIMAEKYDWKVLVLWPNGDVGAKGIGDAIDGFEKSLKKVVRERFRFVDHVPRREFVTLLAWAKVILGNSSAGLIEAAALKTAAVNVGPRQNGREKPRSVVDCDYGKENVMAGVERAVKMNLLRMKHPYGDGTAGKRMAKILAEIDLGDVSLRKCNTF